MYHKHETEIPASPVPVEGAREVSIQWLIDAKTGAKNFFLRRFTVAPEGHTPLHEHPWEHEVYILTGEGIAVAGGREIPVRPGDALFVPGGERHQFRNAGKSDLIFLCLVPSSAKG